MAGTGHAGCDLNLTAQLRATFPFKHLLISLFHSCIPFLELEPSDVAIILHKCTLFFLDMCTPLSFSVYMSHII